MTKKPASKNAFKYDVNSAHVVLPWENEDEFNTLHQGLREEFLPEGAWEEDTVQEIARCQWTKRRMVIGLHAPFYGPQGAALLENELSALPERLASYEEEIERERKARIGLYEEGNMNTIKHFLKDPRLEPEGPRSPLVILMEELVLENGELVEKQKEFASSVNGIIQKIVEIDQRRASIDSVTRPDLVERNLKIEAEVNRQIDKLFTRLAVLKEYKRHYGQKIVSAPPALRSSQ